MENNEKSREDMLVSLMNEKEYRPMKLRELANLLGVSREHRAELAEVLDRLVESGRIGISSHGKYGKPELFTVKGIYSSTSRAFGFVTVEGEAEDIFIPPSSALSAMPGDTVLVAVTSARSEKNGENSSRRREGRIVRILEHSLKTVVGTFQKNKSFGFVIPDDLRIKTDIFIDKGNELDAQNGDKVIAEITVYGDKFKSPEGRVRKILGGQYDPGVDVLSIAAAYGLESDFPDDVKKELEDIPDIVSEAELDVRRDLRSLKTVTIDGEDAKDLDDAVTLSFDGSIYHLGVHIADVTHYVKEGSALDEEAIKRGTSVYLVDRVIPMLPKKLSNGICSLNAGVDRLALSCLMDIDTNGNIISHEICESVIRVDKRMSYTIVAQILEGNEVSDEYSDLADDFKLMAELSGIIREKRQTRGALDFDFPESKFILDEKGRPLDVKPYEHSAATRLIEDFMLLTNETIAEEYFWLDLPFIYRIHPTPDEEKLRSFAILINNFGFSLHIANNTIYPKELQKLLEKIDDNEAQPLISRILLRSMKQAKYSVYNDGHFGLSAKYYCHFTSPIRRYPDLQIHRIIKDNLHKRLDESRIAHYNAILPDICESSSKLERRADETEREVEKLKKAQYMRRHIGDVYEGIISGVTALGFYVELDNTVEGLVKVKTLDDDYYVFRESAYALTGEMTGRTFTIGDKVSIVVSDVDVQARTIDFLLYHGEEDWGSSARSNRRAGSRKFKEEWHGQGRSKAYRK